MRRKRYPNNIRDDVKDLRERNCTDCPFSSKEMKTSLYNDDLIRSVERRLNRHIAFYDAAHDANMRPRFFLLGWIIGIFKIIKKTLKRN